MSESREVDITRWMPFHGLDFFEAVKPYPDYIVAGYLRAIWHYWHHARAEGLPNNQEMLRKICGVEKVEWKEAGAIIFDGDRFFFLGEDDKWHQKRAHAEYRDKFRLAQVNQNRVVKATAASIESRKKNHR